MSIRMYAQSTLGMEGSSCLVVLYVTSVSARPDLRYYLPPPKIGNNRAVPLLAWRRANYYREWEGSKTAVARKWKKLLPSDAGWSSFPSQALARNLPAQGALSPSGILLPPNGCDWTRSSPAKRRNRWHPAKAPAKTCAATRRLGRTKRRPSMPWSSAARDMPAGMRPLSTELARAARRALPTAAR